MKEGKVRWTNREEQVAFGKNISALLQIKFGSVLISDNQGAGEVAILVLTGKGVSKNKMKEIKKYISQSYQLNEKDISGGHGHPDGTIVINISEITNASREIIKQETNNKIFAPVKVKKCIEIKKNMQKTISPPVISVEIEKTEISIEEIQVKQTQIETQNPKSVVMETISLIKKGRALFSVFMTTMFRFEGIISDKKDKIFEFENKKKDQDCQNISFRNEVEAKMAHKALTWFYGEATDLPILEGKDVMVNFFAYDLQINRPTYVSFCFPPIQGEDLERIRKRCVHVLTGYKPSVVEIINDDFFKVNYLTLSTTNKFFGLIQKMGWQVEMKDDFIICKFSTRITSKNEAIVEAPVEIIPVPESKNLGLDKNFISPRSVTEKVNEVFPKEEIPTEEVKSTPETTVAKAETNNLFIPQEEQEVLSELQNLYADKRLFSKLPAEMQKEVFSRIRMNYREEHTLAYAQGLLSFFKK